MQIVALQHLFRLLVLSKLIASISPPQILLRYTHSSSLWLRHQADSFGIIFLMSFSLPLYYMLAKSTLPPVVKFWRTVFPGSPWFWLLHRFQTQANLPVCAYVGFECPQVLYRWKKGEDIFFTESVWKPWKITSKRNLRTTNCLFLNCSHVDTIGDF